MFEIGLAELCSRFGKICEIRVLFCVVLSCGWQQGPLFAISCHRFSRPVGCMGTDEVRLSSSFPLPLRQSLSVDGPSEVSWRTGHDPPLRWSLRPIAGSNVFFQGALPDWDGVNSGRKLEFLETQLHPNFQFSFQHSQLLNGSGMYIKWDHFLQKQLQHFKTLSKTSSKHFRIKLYTAWSNDILIYLSIDY